MSNHDNAHTETLKDAWAKYGKGALAVVIVALVIVLGARFWHQHEYKHAIQASVLYDTYQRALDEQDDEKLTAAYKQIMANYSDTPYASAVSLIEAGRDATKGDLTSAEAQLEWVIQQGEAYTKPLAMMRLAEIKVQAQDFDGALAVLNQADANSPYKPAFDELKGDILVQQGKVDEALALFRDALKLYREQGFDNLLLQYKLETYAPLQPKQSTQPEQSTQVEETAQPEQAATTPKE